MIRFLCPGCRREFKVPLDKAGQVVRCLRCGEAARVPQIDPTDIVPCLEEPRDDGPTVRNCISIDATTPCLIRHPGPRDRFRLR